MECASVGKERALTSPGPDKSAGCSKRHSTPLRPRKFARLLLSAAGMASTVDVDPSCLQSALEAMAAGNAKVSAGREHSGQGKVETALACSGRVLILIIPCSPVSAR